MSTSMSGEIESAVQKQAVITAWSPGCGGPVNPDHRESPAPAGVPLITIPPSLSADGQGKASGRLPAAPFKCPLLSL